MPSAERVQQVKEVIVDHLKNVGPRDWDEVQKDFLDVPTSTFWRYVTKAKAQLEQPAAPSVPTDLFSQAEENGDEPETWEKPQLNTAYRSLKHAQRLHELYADILALRQRALDKDGKICDPQLFAKSIRLRNQLLTDELSVLEGIDATDLKTKFFDALVEALEKASPEVAKTVILALRAHDEETNGGERNATGNA